LKVKRIACVSFKRCPLLFQGMKFILGVMVSRKRGWASIRDNMVLRSSFIEDKRVVA